MLGGPFSILSSGSRVPLDASSLSGSGYSAGSLTIIDKNVSHSHQKIGDSTQILSGYSSCHCPET